MLSVLKLEQDNAATKWSATAEQLIPYCESNDLKQYINRLLFSKNMKLTHSRTFSITVPHVRHGMTCHQQVD